jgi:hypothetical protein
MYMFDCVAGPPGFQCAWLHLQMLRSARYNAAATISCQRHISSAGRAVAQTCVAPARVASLVTAPNLELLNTQLLRIPAQQTGAGLNDECTRQSCKESPRATA